MQHLRYEAICGKIRYALAPLRCVFKQGEAYRTFSFMVHDKENGILFSSEPLNSAYFSNPIVLHHYLKDLRERLADQGVALADWQDCITLEKLATWRKRVLPKPGPTMRAATS
ncbi:MULTISPECIES: hypothetical protein [Pseudomonas]|jgi:hypothetical protein|uniref:Uncharacterized protein n=3 Tax=Pseudomonas TaxID=286 RepID=A0A2X2CF20_PSELU|nr:MULTISPECIES: hypothetical protein [Pseudomonas]ENA29848.1 hypothetical protein HMPREF1487_08102 [Pseudomonas sp. HPB0071]MBA1247585.1 hypothetical protein [Pseudomonas zeshuii]MBF8640818.1 hypothetical protein [Pseudomonas zeshuii]MBH3437420.1 hypothetical protein [Pseudomonas luteola]MBW5414557.1 hypothetical protein [Pseudomonas sp. MAG002Y]